MDSFIDIRILNELIFSFRFWKKMLCHFFLVFMISDLKNLQLFELVSSSLLSGYF